jgi:predicted nuclease with TOPRIM domain
MDDFRSLKDEFKSMKQENKKLKETLEQQADEIAELKNEINEKELHARSWSIQVNNIPVQDGKETDNKAVMQAVHTELVVPILAGAVSAGEIASVPRETAASGGTG